MKKIKRIFAFTGAVLLIGMYASTLIFALLGSKSATVLLRASVAATILIPVLLYGYILIARVLQNRDSDSGDESNIK